MRVPVNDNFYCTCTQNITAFYYHIILYALISLCWIIVIKSAYCMIGHQNWKNHSNVDLPTTEKPFLIKHRLYTKVDEECCVCGLLQVVRVTTILHFNHYTYTLISANLMSSGIYGLFNFGLLVCVKRIYSKRKC